MSLDEFHTAIEAAAPVKSLEEKGFQKTKNREEKHDIHVYIYIHYIQICILYNMYYIYRYQSVPHKAVAKVSKIGSI